MGEDKRGARPTIGLAAALAALACGLGIPAAAAAAATTSTVAQGATREGSPCTAATPCAYRWALENSTAGDTVQFESGVYAFDGAALAKFLVVPAGVTLERAPGDATRPVIEQTTPFKAGFNSPMFILESNVTIRDLGYAGLSGGSGPLITEGHFIFFLDAAAFFKIFTWR